MAVPVLEEIVTGTHLPTTNVGNSFSCTSNLTPGGGDELYLCIVPIRDGSDWGATDVSGGGLTWARALHHKQTQTTIMLDVWWAYGTPSGAFAPSVDGLSIQSGAADTSCAGIHVIGCRISGADSGGPVNVTASDPGATDNNSPSHTETISNANSLILSPLVSRNFTISSTDADYTLVTGSGLNNGSGGNILKSWLHERNSAPAVGTDTIAHTLNAAADWILAGIEIPEGATGVTVTAVTASMTLSAPAAAVKQTYTVTAPLLTLDSAAPSLAWSDTLVSPAALLTLSAASPALTALIETVAGLVTLDAAAPTLTQTDAVVAPAGLVTLSAASPSLLAMIETVAALLTLSAAAPSWDTAVAGAVASMTLDAAAPAIVMSDTIVVPAGALITLDAAAPAYSAAITASPAELTLSAPAASWSTTVSAGNAALMTFDSAAPSLASALPVPAAAELTLSSPTPDVLPAVTITVPDAALMTLDGTVPVIPGQAVTVAAPSGTLTLSIPTDGLTVEGGAGPNNNAWFVVNRRRRTGKR